MQEKIMTIEEIKTKNWNDIDVEKLNDISQQNLLKLLDSIKEVNLGKYVKVRNMVTSKYGCDYWDAFICRGLIMDDRTRKIVLYLIDTV